MLTPFRWPVTRDAARINAYMKQREDYYRHLYATQRGHSDLNDLTATLVDAFAHPEVFQYGEDQFDVRFSPLSPANIARLRSAFAWGH